MVFKDEKMAKAAAEFLKNLELPQHVGVEITFSPDIVKAAYDKIKAEMHTQVKKSKTHLNAPA